MLSLDLYFALNVNNYTKVQAFRHVFINDLVLWLCTFVICEILNIVLEVKKN